MAGTSTKISADVSQFKSAMAQASASVKTLDAALKANEAQYRLTGDRETYMAQKTAALNSQLAKQQSIAKAAEQAMAAMTKNGVDKSSTAYQKMQQQMLNATAAADNIQAELQGIGDSAGDATSKTDGLGKSLNNMGKTVSLDAILGGLNKVTDAMESVAAKAVEVGSKIWSSMVDAAGWADDLATKASIYGVTTDELQRMEYTAKQIDTPVEAIIKARKKLENNMVYGSNDALEAFQKLGVELRGERETMMLFGKEIPVGEGSLRDWNDVFWETGEALMAMHKAGQTVEADAMAQKIFGKGFDELNPLFSAGRAKYEETMAKASTVEDENLVKLQALDDALQDMQSQWQTLAKTAESFMAPAFTELTNGIAGLMTQFNEYLNTEEGQAKMEALGESLTSAFESLTDVDFGEAMGAVSGAIDGLINGLKWVSENGETVTGLITGLGTAFVGLKVSEGVLTFMKILTGAEGLLSGSFDFASAGSAAGSAWGGAFASGLAAAIKAVPALAFLSTLLTPSEAGGSLENPEVDLAQLEQQQKNRDFLKKSGYGADAFTLESYFDLQNLWDIYKNPNKNQADYEKAVKRVQFAYQDRPNLLNSLFEEMEALPKDLEDLPNEYFKLPVLFDTEAATEELANTETDMPVTLDPNTDAIVEEIANTEAHMPVTLDFNLTAGAPTGKIRTPRGWEMPSLPGHATGLPYVPYDGYAAILHKGERVMTRHENNMYSGDDGYELVRALRTALSSVGVYLGSERVGNLTTDTVSGNISRQTNARLRGFGG